MPKQPKPKGKAIKLPETGGEDFTPTKSDINKARELARQIDPVLAAMFDAEEYKPPDDPENDKE